MNDPLTVPAREGIEAQNGLNDIFPGDPYPVSDQLKRGLDALRAQASGRGRISSLEIFALTDPLMDILSRCQAQPAATPARVKDAAVVRLEGEIARLEDELSEARQTWPEWARRVYAFMRKYGFYESSEDDIRLPDDLEAWFDETIETEVNSRLAATRPAEAQAVAEGWKLVPDGDPVELDDCPEGLFDFGGHLGFMTEYATVSEKDGRRHRDAYVVDSGEYFWGGAKTAQERAKLIVQPLAASPATGGA